MPVYDVIILPLAEEDIASNTDYIFYINSQQRQVFVWRVLHMLVDAKSLLMNMRF